MKMNFEAAHKQLYLIHSETTTVLLNTFYVLYCRLWDSRVLQGVVSAPADVCLSEIIMPDYAVYSAATSAHTPAEELMIGGALLPTFERV